MGEHEDGGVERRFVAPPPLPLIVGPRAALRAELVAAHDLRADARSPVAREGVVGAGAPTWLALHGAEGPGADEPSHQPVPGVAEGRLQALVITGAEAVEGDGEVVHANECHDRQTSTGRGIHR